MNDITAGYKETDEIAAIYKTVSWRIVPFAFVCYLIAIIDRSNIAFAQARLGVDAGITVAMYGLGASVFFVSYFLFEVPSNLILAKIGFKATVSRIMIGWGAVSAAMMFVSGPTSFYVLRFLVGMFEAGFFPAVIYMLTFWYPDRRRGEIIGLFMAASAIAPAIGSVISAWLMVATEGLYGLHGWQWMFVLEGLPAVALGFLALWIVDNTPNDAKWLDDRQRRLLLADIERNSRPSASSKSFLGTLVDARVYVMAFAYFTAICAIFVMQFWLPAIIREFGVTDVMSIGLYSAVPFSAGAVAMFAIGRHSDMKRERRWHFFACALLGAVCLSIVPSVTSNFPLSFGLLTLAAFGIYPTIAVFWAIPTTYLSREAAPGAIAFINSLGLLGGIVSPNLIGWFKTHSGSVTSGFYAIAALLLLGAILLILGVSQRLLNEHRQS
jgi:MFS family permease